MFLSVGPAKAADCSCLCGSIDCFSYCQPLYLAPSVHLLILKYEPAVEDTAYTPLPPIHIMDEPQQCQRTWHECDLSTGSYRYAKNRSLIAPNSPRIYSFPHPCAPRHHRALLCAAGRAGARTCVEADEGRHSWCARYPGVVHWTARWSTGRYRPIPAHHQRGPQAAADPGGRGADPCACIQR